MAIRNSVMVSQQSILKHSAVRLSTSTSPILDRWVQDLDLVVKAQIPAFLRPCIRGWLQLAVTAMRDATHLSAREACMAKRASRWKAAVIDAREIWGPRVNKRVKRQVVNEDKERVRSPQSV